MPEQTATNSPGVSPRRGVVRAPRRFAAAAVLVALAVFALWASAPLDAGTMRAVGPGMMPRSIAVLIGLLGLGLFVGSLLKDGEGIGRWPLRGPLFVTLGVVAFALSIRTLGLAVAGPLVVMIGGAASPDARFKELAIFALAITAMCVALFRYALGLSIPVLILPGVITL